MKNKNIFGLISLALLIVFNAVLLFKYKNLKEEYANFEHKISYFDTFFRVMKTNRYEEIINSNNTLNKNSILIDENDKEKFISEIISTNSPFIIIKYSDKGCGACIESELKSIKKYTDLIGEDHIILVTDGGSIRDIKNFKSINGINFNVYRSRALNFYFNDDVKLSVIVTNKDLGINHFFIPDKSLPILSDNNYEAIYDKYYRTY